MRFSWRRISLALVVVTACAIMLMIGRVFYCGIMPVLPNGYAVGRSGADRSEVVLFASERYPMVSRLGHHGIAVDGHVVAVAVEADRFIIVEQRLGGGQTREYYFVIDSVEHTVSGPLTVDRVQSEIGKPLGALRFRRVPCKG